MSTKTIVIFGATGLQGTYLIQALARRNTSKPHPFRIIALTRSPQSNSSQRLAQLPGVELHQVDKDVMEKPSVAFASLETKGVEKGGVHGVFSCQGYVDDVAMVRQGNAIADAAVAFGVKHIVYSSSDFGGLDDTGLSIYEVKRTVENYILKLPIGHTFLRPVQFMENYLPTAPFLFRMGRTVVMRFTFYEHPERKHQLIASRDIGEAGAKAFIEGPEWMGGVVRLAGWEGTVKEIDQIFKEELGQPVQLVFGPLAYFVRNAVPVMRALASFFDKHGYGIDIPAVRKELPELQDLRSFLREYKAKQ